MKIYWKIAKSIVKDRRMGGAETVKFIDCYNIQMAEISCTLLANGDCFHSNGYIYIPNETTDKTSNEDNCGNDTPKKT